MSNDKTPFIFKNLLGSENKVKFSTVKYSGTPHWTCPEGHNFFSSYDSKEQHEVTCPKCNKNVQNPYFDDSQSR